MKIALLVAAVILGLCVVYFAVAYQCFCIALKRRRQRPYYEYSFRNTQYAPFEDALQEGFRWLQSQSIEEISIESEDSLRLCASVIKAPNAKGTILQFHGYRSLPELDFSTIEKKLHDFGFNLVLVNQRSHGKSEGTYIGFGVRERRDCMRWIGKVNELFGEELPLYLDGISMGASTVLMAAGDSMPENLKGIIADCGFTSPYEVVCQTIRTTYHVPPVLIAPAINLYARLLAKYDLKVSTLQTLRTATLPILFIHGDADDFVPYYMSEQAYEACASADKKLVTVKGARHGESYLLDEETVTEELKKFLLRTSGIAV